MAGAVLSVITNAETIVLPSEAPVTCTPGVKNR